MKKPELLAPVSNHVMLAAAIESGADSVYFGLKELNMRITANNFELSELAKVVKKCHDNEVRAYLTVNTIIYEAELDKLKKIIKEAKKANVDAIIAWDMSVVKMALDEGIETHLSTQASVSNSESAKFYKDLGIKRIILARECTLDQIKEIKQKSRVEIETFVHGAMCVSVSGRCFLSQNIFSRSANRGDCLQPCRRKYIIKDPEEDHELVLGEDYVLSPKDMSVMPIIDELIESGIGCFKIEGRNRSPEYVKVVTKAYREAIDLYSEGRLDESKKQELVESLKTVYNRDLSLGFFKGRPAELDFTDVYGSKSTKKKQYIGLVKNYYQKIEVAEIKVETGKLEVGDEMMIQGPTTGVFQQKIDSIEINHKKVDSAVKGDRAAIKTEKIVRPNDKVFLIE